MSTRRRRRRRLRRRRVFVDVDVDVLDNHLEDVLSPMIEERVQKITKIVEQKLRSEMEDSLTSTPKS